MNSSPASTRTEHRGATMSTTLLPVIAGGATTEGEMKKIVQALNPITKRWVKIDTRTGCIIGHKKTLGAYKGINEHEKHSQKR